MKKYKCLTTLLLIVTILLSLAGCGQNTSNKSGTAEQEKTNTDQEKTYVDTIKWDAAYDVVVVGFGGAGAVASITAAE